MKRLLFLSFVIVIGLCSQWPQLLAQDQSPTKGDKKDAEGSPKGGTATHHATKEVQSGSDYGATSGGEKSYEKAGKSAAPDAFETKYATPLSNKAISQNARQSNRMQSSGRQTPAFVVQGNQGNHYDGRWSSASSHSDWDQHIDHRWNNHDYRWYDGGWMIIDVSSGPGYETTGSIGANVQASLAQQGYYGGPIDGDIGRGTRRAISHYESDNGLQVNGRIDEPLLVSLRLE